MNLLSAFHNSQAKCTLRTQCTIEQICGNISNCSSRFSKRLSTGWIFLPKPESIDYLVDTTITPSMAINSRFSRFPGGFALALLAVDTKWSWGGKHAPGGPNMGNAPWKKVSSVMIGAPTNQTQKAYNLGQSLEAESTWEFSPYQPKTS